MGRRKDQDKPTVSEVLDEASQANSQMRQALVMLRELLEVKKRETNGRPAKP